MPESPYLRGLRSDSNRNPEGLQAVSGRTGHRVGSGTGYGGSKGTENASAEARRKRYWLDLAERSEALAATHGVPASLIASALMVGEREGWSVEQVIAHARRRDQELPR